MKERKEKMEQLVDYLNEASDAYYNGKDEVMSNYEWDKMFDELVELEKDTGIVLPNSPTQNTGVKGKGKEEHEFPALSLAKTKEIDEVIKWADKRPVWLSWKLDGCTLVATYDEGKLTKLLTRGNGTVGTNITHLAKAINHLPEKINYKGHLVVRGEALISYSNFEKINSMIEDESEKYANPRNLVAGSLTLDHVEEAKERNIQLCIFTPVFIEKEALDPKYKEKDLLSWGKRMDFLESLGFLTVERVLCKTQKKIKDSVETFTNNVSKFDFPVDGLVICYEDWEYAQTGSVTGHHATRAGFAFKWRDETAVTKITDIIYQTTRTGLISQVATFEPVELCGTKVTKALIPNMNHRADLDLKIGDEIEVFKANMIIPCIASNHNADHKRIKIINDYDRYQYPKNCPCCNTAIGLNISETGVMNLICNNPDCSAKKIKQFVHFCEKDCMNIDGLSEAKITFLIQNGYILNLFDLYEKTKEYNSTGMITNDRNESLSEQPGWGEQSVENLVKSITNSQNCDFVSFMHSMGIPYFGKGQAKLLKKHLENVYYDYEDEMNNTFDNESYTLLDLLQLLVQNDYDFTCIDGFGERINRSLIEWVTFNLINPTPEEINNNSATIIKLIDELNFNDVISKSGEESGLKLERKTFVVTGSVEHFKNRDELKDYIESLGGKVTGSVTKKTDYLINNDLESTSGKNKKAKELNIPIISEEDFLALIK